jgi:hypothetical protein
MRPLFLTVAVRFIFSILIANPLKEKEVSKDGQAHKIMPPGPLQANRGNAGRHSPHHSRNR